MDSILLTVKLAGIIGGPVKHTNRQSHTITLSQAEGGSLTKMITHSDRKTTEACRISTISGDYVKTWVGQDNCPHWEKAKDWKKMSQTKQIESHLMRFDEGFGIEYEFLNDSE